MKHGWRQGHRLEKESDGVIIINKQAQLSLDPTSLVCKYVFVQFVYVCSGCLAGRVTGPEYIWD